MRLLRLMARIDVDRLWYQRKKRWFHYCLIPFSLLFFLIVFIRKRLYQIGILKQINFPVPVIVVGNITLGGTGKTPFVIWLATQFRQQGFRPGIVTRGVGGKLKTNTMLLTEKPDSELVGDEAVLLYENASATVAVGRDRVAGVKRLIDANCDVIISDDGLQHYRLGRDIEIALLDESRGLGNGLMLPAGPLREPETRLRSVDYIIHHVTPDARQRAAYGVYYKPLHWVNVADPTLIKPLSYFNGQSVLAIAAIGNPHKFFHQLASLQIQCEKIIYPDHYQFKSADLLAHREKIILMTEKDAVKCRAFASKDCWFLKVDFIVSDHLFVDILDVCRARRPLYEAKQTSF